MLKILFSRIHTIRIQNKIYINRAICIYIIHYNVYKEFNGHIKPF